MLSFRDPAGHVLVEQDRVLRLVNKTGEEELSAFLASHAARQMLQSGVFVKTEPAVSQQLYNLAASLEGYSVYEHELIRFRNYPFEWPPEMLHAAGTLTLDIAESCLEEGFGLKDASPYNVLFRGPNPVFVDALSFERREPGDPLWLANAQFARNFFLPLLALKTIGIQLDQIFRTRRDGIWPAELYAWAGPLLRLRPSFFSAVTLPIWLSKLEGKSLYRQRIIDPSQARFVLRSLFRSLRRDLRAVQPGETHSRWTRYSDTVPSYDAAQLTAKKEYLETFLSSARPKRVLDIGSNTGDFSVMAAQNGSEVVAIDADFAVAGRLWRRASSNGWNILPLVVDFARPSPALGWRNQETVPFLDRARGAFDAVFLLAVIHHVLLTERVPLEEIISLVAELTTRHAVIEYIGPDDPTVQQLARGREQLYADINPEAFERACAEHFRIDGKLLVPGASRILYVLRKS